MSHILSKLLASIVIAAPCTDLIAAPQFLYLDAAYLQDIYTGPLIGGPGMAWTSSGNLLTRDGAIIREYSQTANATYLGTSIHSTISAHAIAGLGFNLSYGMVNGHDGYIYATTGTGLQRINPATWTVTTPGVDLPGSAVPSGQAWGVTVLRDGRIVYVAGPNTNLVYVFNPISNTNALIYTATNSLSSPVLIDDIEASPTGEIALAIVGSNEIRIISSTGTLVSTVTTLHYPDGLAFGWGSGVFKLFSNDNQGYITKYDFNAGYTSLVSSLTIASGGSYGDLAAVGPDCSLYVSQYYNPIGPARGSTFGTNWTNVTNNDASIVRISSRDGSCAFSPSGGIVAEPSSVLLGSTALALLFAFRLGLITRRNSA